MANFVLPLFVNERVGTTGLPASGRNFTEAVQHTPVRHYNLSDVSCRVYQCALNVDTLKCGLKL